MAIQHDPAQFSRTWDPVDELAGIRAGLARLKAREQVVRAMFLMPGADTRFEGRDHVAEVICRSRKTFDLRRLSAAILADDRYYAMSLSQVVRLRPKQRAAALDDADFDVVEPFY